MVFRINCGAITVLGFLSGSVVKNLPVNAGDGRDGSGTSPGEGNGNPLQYSCLENAMDSGAWWATVQRVAKSQTQIEVMSINMAVLS